MTHLTILHKIHILRDHSYTVKLRTTDIVNNCVKCHVSITTYSTSSENVMINEYVQGQPMYQQPVFYPQYPQQLMMPGQYQGNVGTDPFEQQPTTPNVGPQNFQGLFHLWVMFHLDSNNNLIAS